MDDLRPGIYQHYKGQFYLGLTVARHCDLLTATVLGQARHSETGKIYEVYTDANGSVYVRREGEVNTGGKYALYAPLYVHKGVGLAIRPLTMFNDQVVREEGQSPVPRFRYLGQMFPTEVVDEFMTQQFQRPMLALRLTLGTSEVFNFLQLQPEELRIHGTKQDAFDYLKESVMVGLEKIRERLGLEKEAMQDVWTPGKTLDMGGGHLHVAPFGIRPVPDGQGSCTYQIYNIDTGLNVGDAYPYEQRKDAFRDCKAMNNEWLNETGGYKAIEERKRNANK